MRFFISKVGILNIEIEERNSVLRNTCMIFNWVMKKQDAKTGNGQFKKDLEFIMRILYFVMGNGGMLLDFG